MSSPVSFRASPQRPCPVCQCGTKGCSALEDGLHLCRGEPSAGWKLVKRGDLFNSYRLDSDTRGLRIAPGTAPVKPAPAVDWNAVAEGYAGHLTDDHRNRLADALGLPVSCLSAFPLLGFNANDHNGPCFLFPETDASGSVTGLLRRYAETGEKKMAPNGRHGVYAPDGWRDRPGPVLLVEGASDVLALWACGLCALGRPSNTAGAEVLAELLRDEHREVLVFGENDQKPNGDWPGRKGAELIANRLTRALNRPISWRFPPNGCKDAREWMRQLAAQTGEPPDYPLVGREIVQRLNDPPEPSPPAYSCGELFVESLSDLAPKAVRFLVPDRIPAGMMGLLAGEGGHGKSVTTLHLAAAVSSGRCAFGLEYPNPVHGSVLLISCEDDWQSTVVPRLAAFGADMSRVFRVKGVRMKADGATLDFHLGHFAELNRLLTERPDIKLVIVDPAGAFIGRSGVNENKDAELRTILGPMSETANRTGATTLLVKHLNKSAGVSAVQRVSGSTGYINAVRFAYMFAPDPDDAQRKLMLPIKANVLKSGLSGLAYRLESMPFDEARQVLADRWPDLDPIEACELAKQLVRQTWEGETDTTADTIMGRRAIGKGASLEDCMAFIRSYLGTLSHPEKELQRATTDAGFPFNTFKKAKTTLRCDNRSDPRRLSGKPRGEGGPWWVWIGPQGQPCPDRPEPDQNGTRAAA